MLRMSSVLEGAAGCERQRVHECAKALVLKERAQ